MKSSKRSTKGKATKAAIGKTLESQKQQKILKLLGTIEFYGITTIKGIENEKDKGIRVPGAG